MSPIVSFKGPGGAADPRQVSATDPLPVTVIAPAVAANKATFVRGSKAPADIAVPERIAAVGTFVQSVLIIAQKAGRAGNAGSVFIDSIAGNDAQLVELVPGAQIPFTAPPGKVIDLGDIYVDAVTLGDGVTFLAVL